jgi:DNA-binding CsgD family transcriptional regulator
MKKQVRFKNNPNLTVVEEKVASLLKLGHTDQEIASIIYCSHRTVKAHVYNIKQKMFVDNRVLLALKLHGVKV